MSHLGSVPTSRFVSSRRTLAVAGVVSFLGAFFVVPLYAAMMICSMPCCHQGEQGGRVAIVASEMPGCESQCTMRDVSATTMVDPVIPSPTKDGNALSIDSELVAAVDLPLPRPPLERDRGSSPSGGHAALHVLNSIFRI
ncbi:MAG: hypothetical protein HYU52_14150 [Acidobacteria bacterium]|nr:hypothetical protein [Acidobacteriota bacterium]